MQRRFFLKATGVCIALLALQSLPRLPDELARTGTSAPPLPGPRELSRALFVQDDGKAKAEDRIRLQRSILDMVRDDANSLKQRLNKVDNQKLDLDQHWQDIPKPKPSIDEPRNEGLTKDFPKIYDLLALVLQTDSSRVAAPDLRLPPLSKEDQRPL